MMIATANSEMTRLSDEQLDAVNGGVEPITIATAAVVVGGASIVSWAGYRVYSWWTRDTSKDTKKQGAITKARNQRQQALNQ